MTKRGRHRSRRQRSRIQRTFQTRTPTRGNTPAILSVSLLANDPGRSHHRRVTLAAPTATEPTTADQTATDKLYEGMFLLDSGRFATDSKGATDQLTGMIEKCVAALVAHRSVAGRAAGLRHQRASQRLALSDLFQDEGWRRHSRLDPRLQAERLGVAARRDPASAGHVRRRWVQATLRRMAPARGRSGRRAGPWPRQGPRRTRRSGPRP